MDVPELCVAAFSALIRRVTHEYELLFTPGVGQNGAHYTAARSFLVQQFERHHPVLIK